MLNRFLRAFMALSIIPTCSWGVGSGAFSTQLVGAKALGQGNAFVAQADDPSAVYFNPAGLTQLSGTQLSIGATALMPVVNRTGAGVPEDKMKQTGSVLPNFYLTGSLPAMGWTDEKRVSWGVGLTTPYGLSTQWAPTSSVRYVTTESKIEMVNVNPTLAYQVVDSFSVGIGADYVNITNTTSKSQTNQALANGDDSPDGTSDLSGHGSGWGFNIGGLFKPAEEHSFGFGYRSQVKVPIKGSIELTNLSGSSQANYGFSGSQYTTDSKTSLILPQSALMGYAFRPNSRWTFLLDYEWTQWNSFQNQDIAINESDPGRLAFMTGDPSSNVARTPRHWQNSSTVGVGGNYKLNDLWQFRGGYAYYQHTVPEETFNPDVPDADIHLLTAGLSRSWSSVVVDAAFNGYFYDSRGVTNTVGNASGASVNGTYHNFTPALSVSVTYKFN